MAPILAANNKYLCAQRLVSHFFSEMEIGDLMKIDPNEAINVSMEPLLFRNGNTAYANASNAWHAMLQWSHFFLEMEMAEKLNTRAMQVCSRSGSLGGFNGATSF